MNIDFKKIIYQLSKTGQIVKNAIIYNGKVKIVLESDKNE